MLLLVLKYLLLLTSLIITLLKTTSCFSASAQANNTRYTFAQLSRLPAESSTWLLMEQKLPWPSTSNTTPSTSQAQDNNAPPQDHSFSMNNYLTPMPLPILNAAMQLTSGLASLMAQLLQQAALHGTTPQASWLQNADNLSPLHPFMPPASHWFQQLT